MIKITRHLKLLTTRLRRFSLTRQFMTACALVLCLGMLVIGHWVTQEIERGIHNFAASSAAFYMDSFVGPLVQELGHQNKLSAQSRAELKQLVEQNDFGKRIVALKIWAQDGGLAFSSLPRSESQHASVESEIKRAWLGLSTSKFDSTVHSNVHLNDVSPQHLLEMYSPIRASDTGRIIAVGEFYEDTEQMRQDLQNSKIRSWLMVAAVTLTIFILLSGIVLRGNMTITNQQDTLNERITQLSTLRKRVARDSMMTTEINERYLRRLGADLHDGPAQLLGLALLKLGSLKGLHRSLGIDKQRDAQEIVLIENALSDALGEIRNLSTGLALPELGMLSLTQVVNKAVDMQERRTAINIERDIADLPDRVDPSLTICIFRLIQESLNNAFRHAGADRAKLFAKYNGNTVDVLIEDPGPGFDPDLVFATSDGLGLSGMRERIESLGGFFKLESSPQTGTRVSARFFITDNEFSSE